MEESKKQVIYCVKHPKCQIISICLSQNCGCTTKIFCNRCLVQQQTICNKKVFLEDLEEIDCLSLDPHPFLSKYQIDQLQQIPENQQSSDFIDQAFDKLFNEVSQKIQVAKKSIKSQFQKENISKADLLKQIKQVYDWKKIDPILQRYSQNKDQSKLETEIKQFIQIMTEKQNALPFINDISQPQKFDIVRFNRTMENVIKNISKIVDNKIIIDYINDDNKYDQKAEYFMQGQISRLATQRTAISKITTQLEINVQSKEIDSTIKTAKNVLKQIQKNKESVEDQIQDIQEFIEQMTQIENQSEINERDKQYSNYLIDYNMCHVSHNTATVLQQQIQLQPVVQQKKQYPEQPTCF